MFLFSFIPTYLFLITAVLMVSTSEPTSANIPLDGILNMRDIASGLTEYPDQ